MSLFARAPRRVMLLGFLASAGCGTSEVRPTVTISALRLVHASPSLPTLDVTYGGTLIWSALQPGTASSYLQVVASTARLVARQTGTTNAPVADTSLVLPNGAAQTIIFSGTPALPAYLLLADAPGSGTPGRTDLRLVHAAAGTAAIDIYLTLTGQPRSETPTVAALGYAANSDYRSIRSGVYDMRVTPAGDTTTTLYTRALLQLGSGGAGTFVLADPPTAGGPLGAVLVADR